MISAALAILETDEQRNELSEIYKSNVNKFYSIAFSKLHNKQDTEDAIQEAFLAIANNPEPFFDIPENKRISYINVIIRNAAYKIWNNKHKVYENEIALDDEVVDERISVEETILSNYSCEQLLNFIDTLPETTKAALYLKMHLGLKNDDIAKDLGISYEAAKKRVARAMEQIRKYMEDFNDE
jgi:RNA polymerase sigma-70 factor (ECF subfamily)